MEDHENIHDKLSELFGSASTSFNIIQRQIDVNLQMNYFDSSRRVKKGLKPHKVLEESEKLFDGETEMETKKDLLARLASVEEVKAFRVIEKFYREAPEELSDWTALAYQESRMLLESKLLDENQVLISTGLGGMGEKLRYFVVVLSKTGEFLNDTQKKIINSEFRYILRKYDSEIEDIRFFESMATIKALVPMDKVIKKVFEDAIIECNEYGSFLKDNFIITNVKELSFKEIKEYLVNSDYILQNPEDE